MEVKRILLLLRIACLCHKGIHLPSLCAFYGNVLRKILPNERRRSRRAHTESAVNTPLVTEQMTESVHIPPACGRRLLTVSPENHVLFINSYTHIRVYRYISCRSRHVHTNVITRPSMTEGKIDSDNLFCFMPHSCCRELAHSRRICRFNIDLITTVLLQQPCVLMLWAWPVFPHGTPTVGYCGRRN